MSASNRTDELYQNALKPLLILSRLYGVDLYPSKNTLTSKLWLAYSLLVFGLDIGCCIFLNYQAIVRITDRMGGSYSATGSWSTILDLEVFYVFTVLSHFCLVFSSRSPMDQLWTSLSTLDLQLDSGAKFWTDIRRNSCIATALVIIIDVTYVGWATLSLDHNFKFRSIRILVLTFHQLISKACIFYYVVAKALGSIFRTVEKGFEESYYTDNANLLGWCKIYRESCSAISTLVQSFRFILLVCTVQTFCLCITTSFLAVVDFSAPVRNYWHLSYTLCYSAETFGFFLLFWSICYVSDDITKKAKSVSSTVSDLQLKYLLDSPFHTKVNVFVVQATKTVPDFTILGMFTLSQRLIPTLLGTALTYLVILWQFQAAESSPCTC